MSDKIRTILEIEKERNVKPHFGNGITVASGFDLGAKSALDSRLTAKTLADRDAHVTGNRAYEGMIVYVEETKKTYQLIDNTWVEFGFNQDKLEQSIVDNLTTDSTTSALSARQGKVLNEKIEAHVGDDDVHITQEERTKIANTYTKGEVDEVVQRIDTAHASLSQKVEALEGLDLGNKFNGLEESIGEINTKIEGIEEQITETDGKIGTLQTTVTESIKQVNTEIGTLKQEDLNIKQSITDLEASLKSADNVLEGKIADTLGKITAVEGNVEEAVNSLEELKDSLDAEIERATEAEGELSNRLDVIEGEETQEGSIKKALKDAKEFTNQKIADLIDGAPEALDTLREIAEALQQNEGAIGGIVNTLATKASKTEVEQKADKDYVDNELAKETQARKEADDKLTKSVSDLTASVDSKEADLRELINKMATVVSVDEPEDRLTGHVWLELI